MKGAAAPNGSAFGDAPSRQLGEAASSRPVFSSAVGESAFAYPSKGTADSTPAPAEGYSSEYSDARGSVAVPVGENRSQQAVRQPDTASAIAPGGHFQPPAGDSAVSIGEPENSSYGTHASACFISLISIALPADGESLFEDFLSQIFISHAMCCYWTCKVTANALLVYTQPILIVCCALYNK